MDTNVLVWIIVGVIVLLIVVGVAVYFSRRRREAQAASDRQKAQEVRVHAQDDALAAR